MNKKVKALWLKALRSGKYKQARGQLKKGNGFCCLGVLTDLYLQEMREIVASNIKFGGSPEDLLTDVYIPEPDDADLSKQVQDWAGLDSCDPNVQCKKDADMESLSYLNDTKKFTFKQIANAIEKNL
jgi:hypothetical protein